MSGTVAAFRLWCFRRSSADFRFKVDRGHNPTRYIRFFLIRPVNAAKCPVLQNDWKQDSCMPKHRMLKHLSVFMDFNSRLQATKALRTVKIPFRSLSLWQIISIKTASHPTPRIFRGIFLFWDEGGLTALQGEKMGNNRKRPLSGDKGSSILCLYAEAVSAKAG